jgi:UDP-N-acetylenolpyruvoylglucosamine reductase
MKNLKYAITNNFWYMGKFDGKAILMAGGFLFEIYELSQTFEEMFKHEAPFSFNTSILPYEDKITIDGLFAKINFDVTEEKKRELFESMEAIKNNRGFIKSLPMKFFKNLKT